MSDSHNNIQALKGYITWITAQPARDRMGQYIIARVDGELRGVYLYSLHNKDETYQMVSRLDRAVVLSIARAYQRVRNTTILTQDELDEMTEKGWF